MVNLKESKRSFKDNKLDVYYYYYELNKKGNSREFNEWINRLTDSEKQDFYKWMRDLGYKF